MLHAKTNQYVLVLEPGIIFFKDPPPPLFPVEEPPARGCKKICCLGVMLPRWQHRLFLTSLPITRTINNFSWIRQHERILTHGNKPEVPCCTTETKTVSIEVRGVATPPGQLSTTLRGLLWVYGSSGGKREPRSDIQILGFFMGVPTLVSHSRDHRKYVGLNHWEGIWLEQRSGEGFQATSIHIVENQFPACKIQVVVLTSDFADLQNQGRSVVWPGNQWGEALPDLGFISFAHPEAWSAHTQAEKLNHSPLNLLWIMVPCYMWQEALMKTSERCYVSQKHVS